MGGQGMDGVVCGSSGRGAVCGSGARSPACSPTMAPLLFATPSWEHGNETVFLLMTAGEAEERLVRLPPSRLLDALALLRPPRVRLRHEIKDHILLRLPLPRLHA